MHLKRLFLLTSAFLILTAVFLFLLFLDFYPVHSLFKTNIVKNTKIYDRNNVLLYETLHSEGGRTTFVPLKDIPKPLIQAAIATEDINFYENSGIDFEGILRAVFLNLKEGRIVSGGSTITQQLARNVIGLGRKRTLFEKTKESLLALRITKVFSKDEILELYFNKVYYGNLNYGVESASRGYFGKDISNLDLAQSAFLAGLPQAPTRYDPFEHPKTALKRKDYVLSLMHKNGFINDAEFKEAKNEELKFTQNLVLGRAPHFVSYVIEELEDRFGENYVSDLEVKTSLDYHMQAKIQDIVERNLALLKGRNVTNGSVVILEPKTAEILAMVGSADYFDEEIDGQVNIAISPRQPGSAMKPITYAVAFEKGWNGATLIKDEPVRFFTAEGAPYLPRNYDFEYHGIVTAREALANSYNIPAVKTIDFAGVEAVLGKARAMGLKTLTQSADYYGLALTLGDAEVKLLDLASAYMVFANKGLYKAPQAILEIKNSASEILYTKPYDIGKRVLSPEISFMVTDILADNNARIPEFGLNNVLELDRPAAVKTGTTRNFKDNWTLGFTPDYVAGVWVGNSDNSEMRKISGIYGAGPIWHDAMTEIHRGVEEKSFDSPSGIERKEFCVEEIDDMEKCRKRVWEWMIKNSKFQNPNDHSSTNYKLQIAKIRIRKPFDQDVFKWNSNIPNETQQIKFEAEEDADTGEILWFVNGEEVGRGDSMFWSLKIGEFEIQARARDIKSEKVRIRVE